MDAAKVSRTGRRVVVAAYFFVVLYCLATIAVSTLHQIYAGPPSPGAQTLTRYERVWCVYTLMRLRDELRAPDEAWKSKIDQASRGCATGSQDLSRGYAQLSEIGGLVFVDASRPSDRVVSLSSALDQTIDALLVASK